jgi:iron complex outermembrane receptor protein
MRLDRKTLLATTVLAGFTLWAPTLAVAQTAPPAPAAGANEVTEVVVTGSRIKRNEFNSAAPIQVITADTATLEGLATTSEILQSSSLVAGAFQTNNQLTGFVTLGGGGASNISLRGLGPNRTLVLVDGHRMGPAGTGGTVGPFDLNVIPSAIVDRVEILKDGASSIYGSDAVAGVVNLITKKNLDGGVINASGRIDQHPGGNNYDVNAAWGKVYDHGFWNVAADFSDQEILTKGQRPDVECASNYLFDATTFARVDVLGLNGSPACFNSGGSGFNKITTLNFGSVIYPDPGVTYPGITGGNSGGTNNAAGGFQGQPVPFGLIRQARAGFPGTFAYQHQTDPLYDNQAIVTGSKLYTFTARGGYDITPDTELTAGLLLNRRSSNQPSVGQFFPAIPTTNPNNPFGNAFGAGTITPVSARSIGSAQQVDYANAYINLKGKLGQFPVFGGWDWEMHARASKSVGTYDQDFTYQDRVNAISGATLACNQALITISQNQPGGTCASIGGALPLFAPAELAGRFTPAEKLFLFGKEQGKTTYDEQEFEATMTGDLFSLPAGKVGAAFGVDYRHNSIDDTPGYNTRNNNLWGFSASGITKGSDAVKEVFGEVDVPLLKNLPLFRSLDLQASGRYTDYDSYGSSSTYKVGLDWRVTDWMRLRATRGTSFRAPALYELFLANQTSFLGQTQVDPCIQWGSSGNANLQKNCLAAGVTDPNYAGLSSSALITTGGGHGHLKAETSMADTLGVVFTPSFIDFSLAVDYTSIQVDNEVTTFAPGNIANVCYTSAAFPANPFCTLVQRGGFQGVALPPSGQPAITAINSSYVNVAHQGERAIDVTTRYRHDFDSVRLQVDTQMTWDLQNQSQLLNSFPGANYAGTTFAFKGPQFSGNATIRLDRGPWTALWFIQVLGKGSDQDLLGSTATSTTVSSTCRVSAAGGAFPVGTVAPCSQLVGNSPFAVVATPVALKYYTEMTAYHSISLRRTFDSWTVQGGIQNLFDERPPSVSTGEFRSGTAALNGFDIFGRRFFFNITKKF